jgi:hypothetical protein
LFAVFTKRCATPLNRAVAAHPTRLHFTCDFLQFVTHAVSLHAIMYGSHTYPLLLQNPHVS